MGPPLGCKTMLRSRPGMMSSSGRLELCSSQMWGPAAGGSGARCRVLGTKLSVGLMQSIEIMRSSSGLARPCLPETAWTGAWQQKRS